VWALNLPSHFAKHTVVADGRHLDRHAFSRGRGRCAELSWSATSGKQYRHAVMALFGTGRLARHSTAIPDFPPSWARSSSAVCNGCGDPACPFRHRTATAPLSSPQALCITAAAGRITGGISPFDATCLTIRTHFGSALRLYRATRCALAVGLLLYAYRLCATPTCPSLPAATLPPDAARLAMPLTAASLPPAPSIVRCNTAGVALGRLRLAPRDYSLLAFQTQTSAAGELFSTPAAITSTALQATALPHAV